MKKTVLGVKIDDITKDQVIEQVKEWIKGSSKHYIVTPNPEIVVAAVKDEELLGILNNADLSIPDGHGLKILTDVVCNTTGIDTMEALVKMANDLGVTVGFLGGRRGVAGRAVERLKKKHPNLQVSFASDGGEIDEGGNMINDLGLKINADLLFVAFGPPKQEKWIAKNLNKSKVKVMMSVGGSLDYLAGEVMRAPQFLRELGLEWLFRLFCQPWRIKRQLALIKYIWLLTQKRMSD